MSKQRFEITPEGCYMVFFAGLLLMLLWEAIFQPEALREAQWYDFIRDLPPDEAPE